MFDTSGGSPIFCCWAAAAPARPHANRSSRPAISMGCLVMASSLKGYRWFDYSRNSRSPGMQSAAFEFLQDPDLHGVRFEELARQLSLGRVAGVAVDDGRQKIAVVGD